MHAFGPFGYHIRIQRITVLRSVHSRPERRPRVGRICDKDLKCIMPFIVGRTSAARRPHAADLASDHSDHSDSSAACGHWRKGSNPHTIEVRNEL